MTYGLSPHISFCSIGDRSLFLDRRADRYFELKPATARAFGKLVSGAAVSAEDERPLAALIEGGVLRPSTTPPRPIARPVPGAIVQPQSQDRATSIEAIRLAGAQWRESRLLHRKGLAHRLAHLEQRKRAAAGGWGRGPITAGHLVSIVRRASLVRSRADRCLPHALTLATWGVKHGLAATTFVIGVKLGPFEAHAWVEADGLALGEELDYLRGFTPILAI